MKKITALVLAAAVVIGVVATSPDTKTLAKVDKDQIILMSEVGPGGGAGWYIYYSCDDTVKQAVSLRVFMEI